MLHLPINKRGLACLAAITLFSLPTVAQTRYDHARLKAERLGRGVVAVRAGQSVVVSWRTLPGDNPGEAFDVYRNGQKLNTEPLTTGGTFFVDQQPLDGEAVYEVRGGQTLTNAAGQPLGGTSWTLRGDRTDGCLTIPLTPPTTTDSVDFQPRRARGNRPQQPRGNRPENPWQDGQQRMAPPGEPNDGSQQRQQPGEPNDGSMQRQQPEMPQGRRAVTYSANDASVMDVDGDGEYEIVVKWDPTNSHDNAHTGPTSNVFFDCYRLTGERLWRIDMGPNIRAGAHYTQFICYDLDGDGKGEMMVKTADGTIDGTGQVIGDSTRHYRDENPQSPLYGRIQDGAEYLTVFEGLTGGALKTVDYVPDRYPDGSFGDTHGNRGERYLAALAFLDGEHPAAVFCRGYYARTTLAAWRWDGNDLKLHWYFDSDPQKQQQAMLDSLGLTNKGNADCRGQGNHNLRVADVDGDGCDEITYGSMAVDHDGSILYNTQMGHGDAMHLVADPKTDRLYIWDCHENRRDGSDLRDAATGKVVWQQKANFDVGRAMAADIDSTRYGVEVWSSNVQLTSPFAVDGGLTGAASVTTSNEEEDFSSMQRPAARLSCNFAVWWTGGLTRQLLDRATVTRFNPDTEQMDVVRTFDGLFNNGTKSNPCLSADILGDWREEVIVRNQESTELRIYTTDHPTSYRIPCLMTDIPYRESVAAENVAYNQPPELGYYLGPDKPVGGGK